MGGWGGPRPSGHEREGRRQASRRSDAGRGGGPWRDRLGPAIQAHADAHLPTPHVRARVPNLRSADYCPCGGTHLKNVSEIGTVHILEKRSKGKETDRIVYELLAG